MNIQMHQHMITWRQLRDADEDMVGLLGGVRETPRKLNLVQLEENTRTNTGAHTYFGLCVILHFDDAGCHEFVSRDLVGTRRGAFYLRNLSFEAPIPVREAHGRNVEGK
jgi:hypothetical protein